ncbi:U-scoloptoxin(19)-Sm1a-like [Papilio machaon]|uniref:U-scoloptoxin(19)-Sm1a-like n=1 Tax=Papilio machaon TaxID=76193 RepID=UPI0006EB0D91|nr:U-scoloptoxin(19)-Sm1a-like [Papilio machaon]
MHFRTVFFVTVLLLVTVDAVPLERAPMELINFITMEEPCVRQGGLCRRIEDCDQDNLVHMRGVLCPKQRHLGVECCYN